MAFERYFINQPINVIFKFLSCLQHWQVLLTGDDGSLMDRFSVMAEVWLKTFVIQVDFAGWV